MRVVRVRTGVVLDRHAGALKTMLLPFRLGVGGPVAGGRQPMPWIHLDDVIGIYLAAIDDERWSGPVHATAPQPVSNREFSKALGRALHRPAIVPVPAFALKPPLRRDVEAGARGPERGAPPHHRARVPPPAPGPRRGPAFRTAGHLTTAGQSLVKSCP